MGVVTGTQQGELVGVVASAAEGDEIAFGRIVAAYHDDLCRVCAYVTGDHDLAEEAVQSAWAIAWQKLTSLREPERLRSWLMRVAVNEAKRLLEKQARRRRLETTIDASRVPAGRDPATGVDSLDLLAAIGRLAPEERGLLAMRYVAGLDSNELASVIGLTPSGTRSRIERLLARLRKDVA
jgi:RNA polymerase sigma-70 factor (ECF subfamily)